MSTGKSLEPAELLWPGNSVQTLPPSLLLQKEHASLSPLPRRASLEPQMPILSPSQQTRPPVRAQHTPTPRLSCVGSCPQSHVACAYLRRCHWPSTPAAREVIPACRLSYNYSTVGKKSNQETSLQGVGLGGPSLKDSSTSFCGRLPAAMLGGREEPLAPGDGSTDFRWLGFAQQCNFRIVKTRMSLKTCL